MDWCSENVQQNQNKEEEGLATAAAVTQAARERKAGCLPPCVGQSGQSGQSGAPAAKREEPNGPSGKTAPPPPQVRHAESYQGDVTPTPQYTPRQINYNARRSM